MTQETGDDGTLPSRRGIGHVRNRRNGLVKNHDRDADRANDDDQILAPRLLFDLLRGKGKDNFTPPPFLTSKFPFIRLPSDRPDTPTPTPEPAPEPATSTTETPTTTEVVTTFTPSEPVESTPVSTTPVVTIPVVTIPIVTSTSVPTTDRPTTNIPTTNVEAPLPSTLSTITLTSTTTSMTIQNAAYETAPAMSMEKGPLPPAHMAGIIIGSIAGILSLLALAFFCFRRRRRRLAQRLTSKSRSSTAMGNSLLQSAQSLGVGNTVTCEANPSAQPPAPGSTLQRPRTTYQRWITHFKQIIPHTLSLTTVPEEDSKKQPSTTRSTGPKSIRSMIIPRILTRQPSPSSSPSNSDQTDPPSIDRATPFRNSSVSDVSSTWMTTATQKTDSTFFPPTALRLPSVPPKEWQVPGPGPGADEERGVGLRPPPPSRSRWLTPGGGGLSRPLSYTQRTFDDPGDERSVGGPGPGGSDRGEEGEVER